MATLHYVPKPLNESVMISKNTSWVSFAWKIFHEIDRYSQEHVLKLGVDTAASRARSLGGTRKGGYITRWNWSLLQVLIFACQTAVSVRIAWNAFKGHPFEPRNRCIVSAHKRIIAYLPVYFDKVYSALLL